MPGERCDHPASMIELVEVIEVDPGQRPERRVVDDVGVGDRAERVGAADAGRGQRVVEEADVRGCRRQPPWRASRGRRRGRRRSRHRARRRSRHPSRGRSRRPAARPGPPSAGRSRSATRRRAWRRSAGPARPPGRPCTARGASRRCRGSSVPTTSVTGVPSGSDCSWAFSALKAGTPPVASSARSLSLAVTQSTPTPAASAAAWIVVARRKLGIGDLDLEAVLRAVVVAGDPVSRGADAGHDRDVVRVGEGRHLGAAERVAAAARDRLAEARHQLPLERVIDVLRIPAVCADREDLLVRSRIGAVVGGEPDAHLKHDYTS